MSRRWGFGIARPGDRPHDFVGGSPRTLLQELCDVVGSAAGIVLEPVLASTYTELAESLVTSDLGLAWLPPVPTLDLAAREAASVLAIPSRGGATSYHSALIVRRGRAASIKTLAELRGRRAAWVQRESAAGYLMPRLHLAAQGVDVLRFFAREIFVHSHAGVVDAVVSGEADVGATYCNVDAEGRVIRGAWLDERGEATRPIEALATMGPIPNDALVASSALPAGARSALVRFHLGLEDASTPGELRAREIYGKLLGASDFRVPSPDHYDALAHALRAGRARGQTTGPRSSRMRLRTSK